MTQLLCAQVCWACVRVTAGRLYMASVRSSSRRVGAAQPDDDCVGATQPAASSSIVAQ